MSSLPEASWPPVRIAAGVVLYHPQPTVEVLIETLAGQFEDVFVVENESRTDVAGSASIRGIHNSTNRGLAVANNQLCAAARAAGFEWMLLFDQDSRVPDDFRQHLEACFAALAQPPALLAANYRTELLGESFVGYRLEDNGMAGELTVALNSGAMINLDVHAALGGHDETFFVDHVDHEYCLRLRRQGFEIYGTAAPLFEHMVGNVVCTRRLGRIWQSSGHPAARRREWARNLLRLVRRYWRTEFRWCVKRLLGELPRSVIAMLILEPHRGAKLMAVVSGVARGIAGPR